MTLQNGMIHNDRAFLWTDEGYFEAATGKLLFTDSKAQKGLKWPYALSTSSNGGNPHDILQAASENEPANLAALLANVVRALRAYAAKGFTANVLVAAWEVEARLFYVSTIDGALDEPAFTPVEILHHVCTGTHLPAYHEAVAAGLTPETMAKVIDAQIEHPFELQGPMAAAGKRLWFGGGIVQIEVTRDGVSDRVLRMV
jgi:hypothetical protein